MSHLVLLHEGAVNGSAFVTNKYELVYDNNAVVTSWWVVHSELVQVFASLTLHQLKSSLVWYYRIMRQFYNAIIIFASLQIRKQGT